MFWVSSYYLKQDKASAYQQWLLSPEARALTADVERELGMKYGHLLESYGYWRL